MSAWICSFGSPQKAASEGGKRDFRQLCQHLLNEGAGSGAGFLHALIPPHVPSVFSTHTLVTRTQDLFSTGRNCCWNCTGIVGVISGQPDWPPAKAKTGGTKYAGRKEHAKDLV